MNKLKNTFLSKNYLKISDKLNHTVDLMSNIDLLIFQDLYQINIDNILINRNVFSNTKSVRIWGIVKGIENNFFRRFRSLKRIGLEFYNFNRFIYKTKHWSFLDAYGLPNYYEPFEQYLKNNTQSVVFLGIMAIDGNVDGYSDEDFCLYYHFPHNKLYYPISFNSGTVFSDCNCTLIWLNKMKPYYERYFNFNRISSDDNGGLIIVDEPEYFDFFELATDLIPNNCKNDDIHLMIKQCNFSERIKTCNISSINGYHMNYYNYYLPTFYVNMFEFTIEFIILPIFGSIGIVFNVI